MKGKAWKVEEKEITEGRLKGRLEWKGKRKEKLP